MESAITGLIIIGVLVLALLGISQAALSAQGNIAEASLAMQARMSEQIHTAITPVQAACDPAQGNWVNLTIQNNGAIKLAEFDRWDVLLQYTDFTGVNRVEWDTYKAAPGPHQWSMALYQNARTPEVFEPNIFNPGEQMVLHIVPSFSVGQNTINRAVVATPSGITATTVFTR